MLLLRLWKCDNSNEKSFYIIFSLARFFILFIHHNIKKNETLFASLSSVDIENFEWCWMFIFCLCQFIRSKKQITDKSCPFICKYNITKHHSTIDSNFHSSTKIQCLLLVFCMKCNIFLNVHSSYFIPFIRQ